MVAIEVDTDQPLCCAQYQCNDLIMTHSLLRREHKESIVCERGVEKRCHIG